MSRVTLWAVVTATTCMTLVGCGTHPVTGERQLVLIGPEQEVALGREAAPELEAQLGGAVSDPVLQQYVREVGNRVAAQSHRPELEWHFTVVNSDTPNALALPGGFIFITRGLLVQMENEAELAAVLGHEVGHVAALHNVQAIQRVMGVQIFASVLGSIIGGTAGQVAEAGTQVAGAMFQLRYSREAEYESDRLGMEYIARSGYNPYGMVLLMETLAGLSEEQPGRVAEMFRTHPLTSDRIAHAIEIFRTEYPQFSPAEPVGFNTQQFRQMQARLR